MAGRLLLFLLAIAGLVWFLYWFRKTPSARVARRLRQGALWGGIGLVFFLALTGRLNPLFAAVAAAIPVVMRGINLLLMLPAIRQALRSLGLGGLAGGGIQGAATAGGGQTSAIRTRFLAMSLDHATGDLDGMVLEGEFQGRHLSSLSQAELFRLLDLCRLEDSQSAALLEAYLDRTQGAGWQAGAAGAGTDSAPGDGGVQTPGGRAMNREEALAVLGLGPAATEDDIRAAHRRLMQRLHPDRGGSDYLAAKINEAKRVLLGD
jgi:hypothetical protein